MIPVLIKHGAATIYIITAIAVPASAYLLKDTKYDKAWLFTLAIGIVLAAAFEMYSKTKNKC